MRGTIGISAILLLHCNPVLSYFIQKEYVTFLFMREKMEVLYNPLTTAL